LEEMMKELSERGKNKGLVINMNKTKILAKNEIQRKVEIDGKIIEEVEEIIYVFKTKNST